MQPAEFWQNFKLGQEVEIASNFIYDGLKNFHHMDTLGEEREIFPVLYNLSIGLERLFKVAIVLSEFQDDTCVECFEKSLKTHNHTKLLKKIDSNHLISFGPKHVDLLKLLSNFYQNQRYDRFSLKNFSVNSKDKESLLQYLHDHNDVEINDDSTQSQTQNSDEIRDFVGRVVKDITVSIYEIIRSEARRKNLYTYEISSSYSKASKILLTDEPIEFQSDEIALIEAFVFLLNTKESSLVDFMKELDPLELDPALASEYLKGVLRGQPREVQSLVDEVEAYHQDSSDIKNRLDMIKTIKDNSECL